MQNKFSSNLYNNNHFSKVFIELNALILLFYNILNDFLKLFYTNYHCNILTFNSTL